MKPAPLRIAAFRCFAAQGRPDMLLTSGLVKIMHGPA